MALGWFGATGRLAADPVRPAPKFVAGGQADQEEGRRALQEFRSAGLAGDYWLDFELRVMPHRGEETMLRGQILGTRGDQGPVTRLSVQTPGGGTAWLIQGGPQPDARVSTAGGPVRAVSAAETLAPVAGTDLTLFDLQMPFLYWDDFVYEGLANIRGRPAYSLILYPPAAFAAQRPELAAVRVALDTQFHALVQAEQLGPKGEALKSITVLDLKKTDGQWIVKTIDLRNAVTRDKTRFNVTAAALGLTLPPGAFEAASLSQPAPAPDPAKVERF